MSKQKELLSVIERFSGTPVTVLGDLIVDQYVWGKVDRISPEAPVVVVKVQEENQRSGGAGNVARNLVALGAKVSVCGLVGDDVPGRNMVAQLGEDGVDTDGILVDRNRPTTIKTRVIAHAQQVVRVDREATDMVSPGLAQALAAGLDAQFEKSKGIIISDYAKGAIGPSLFESVRSGYQRGLLGFGKVPVLVDPKSPNFPMYIGPTVVKPNRQEAEQASGVLINSREDALEAGRLLLEKWQTELVLITLGEQGMVLVPGSDLKSEASVIETVAREVYDVSGAGDTVSAVFTLALAVGASPEQAARLANYAAGVVVAEVGTVAITKEQLFEAVEHKGEEH